MGSREQKEYESKKFALSIRNADDSVKSTPRGVKVASQRVERMSSMMNIKRTGGGGAD